jgi:hypothetical protein
MSVNSVHKSDGPADQLTKNWSQCLNPRRQGGGSRKSLVFATKQTHARYFGLPRSSTLAIGVLGKKSGVSTARPRRQDPLMDGNDFVDLLWKAVRADRRAAEAAVRTATSAEHLVTLIVWITRRHTAERLQRSTPK